jgi:hypothetical protein
MEVKEDETVQQQEVDVEKLNVKQNFSINAKSQEEAYSNHVFIQ